MLFGMWVSCPGGGGRCGIGGRDSGSTRQQCCGGDSRGEQMFNLAWPAIAALTGVSVLPPIASSATADAAAELALTTSTSF